MPSYIMPKTITEAASLLDVVKPHWFELINVERLDMAHGTRCIFGQLYGSFVEGINILFGTFGSHVDAINNSPFGICAKKEDWLVEIGTRILKREHPSLKLDIPTTNNYYNFGDGYYLSSELSVIHEDYYRREVKRFFHFDDSAHLVASLRKFLIQIAQTGVVKKYMPPAPTNPAKTTQTPLTTPVTESKVVAVKLPAEVKIADIPALILELQNMMKEK